MPWNSRREGRWQCQPKQRSDRCVAPLRLSSSCNHLWPWQQQLELRRGRGSQSSQRRGWICVGSGIAAHPLRAIAVDQRMRQRPWTGPPPPPPPHPPSTQSNRTGTHCCSLSSSLPPPPASFDEYRMRSSATRSSSSSAAAAASSPCGWRLLSERQTY